MKYLTLILVSVFFSLPAIVTAEESIDAPKAILGTWVLDEKATWDRFRESPAWLNMTPEQQLEYRTTVWPKVQTAILSMAYHFKQREIMVVANGKQNFLPAAQVDAGDGTVVYQIGEGTQKTQLIMNFINPNLITIQTSGSDANYFVWKRQGKPDSE